MFKVKSLLKLQGQSVLRDLILETGFHQDIRSTPYFRQPGYFSKLIGKDWVNNQYSMTLEEFAFKLPGDFDADSKKPLKDYEARVENVEDSKNLAGCEFNVLKDKYASFYDNWYARRLEDIKLSQIAQWIENDMYVARKKDGILTKYEKEFGRTPMLPGYEDDDEEGYNYVQDLTPIYTRDLVSDSKVVEQILDDMLFHMKRLFLFGIKMKINILTFVSAYERAKAIIDEDRRRAKAGLSLQKSVTASVTAARVRQAGYYEADAKGNATKPFVDTAHDVNSSTLFRWISGNLNDMYKSYLDDYLALHDDADKLHINLAKEDMRKYDSEFFDKVTITKITPDKQYIANLTKALRYNENTKATGNDYNFGQSLAIFYDVYNSNKYFQKQYEKRYESTKGEEDAIVNSIEEFLAICNKYLKNTERPSLITFSNGVAVHKETGEAILFNLRVIYERKTQKEIPCLLSDTGLLLTINDPDEMYIMTAERAKDLLVDYIQGGSWEANVGKGKWTRI